MTHQKCSVPDCGADATTLANIVINGAPRRMLPVCQCHFDSVIEEGKAQVEALKASSAKHLADREESFERCDTDGFLSQWAHGISSSRDHLASEVAAQGFTSEFPALFDLQGNLVAAKLIACNNPYGHSKVLKWGVLENDDPRSKVTAWITAHPARVSTMEKKGYREGTVRAPAKADIVGEKTAYATILRVDGGFSRNVIIVDNGMLVEAK